MTPDAPVPTAVRHRVLIAIVGSILLIALLLLILAAMRLTSIRPHENPWDVAAGVSHDGVWVFHWQQAMEREILPLIHPAYGMIDPGLGWFDEALSRSGMLLFRDTDEFPAPHWAMCLTLRAEDVVIGAQLEEFVELLGVVTPPNAPKPTLLQDKQLVVITTSRDFGGEIMGVRQQLAQSRPNRYQPLGPIHYAGPLGGLPTHIGARVRASDADTTNTLYQVVFLPAQVVRTVPEPVTQFEPMPILVLPSSTPAEP